MYASSLPSTSYTLDAFTQTVQQIRASTLYESLEQPDWNHFQKTFLLSKPIQSYYSTLLKHFERLRLKARDLLIGYTFIYFDTDTITTELYRATQQWIQVLHTAPLEEDIRSALYHSLTQYERLYFSWKEEDRHKMLEKMTQMYWEYEINYRLYETQLVPEEKEHYLTEKQTRQAECLSMMKKIDNLAYFHKYQPVFMDSAFSEVLIETLRRAFWDRLKASLLTEPPDFEPLYALFVEIREHLDHIHQRRPNLIEHFDDMIDIQYFKQRQEHQPLSLDFWMSRLEYLFDLLLKIDSAERESQHKSILDDLKNKNTLEACIDGLAHLMNRLLEIRKMYDAVFNPE